MNRFASLLLLSALTSLLAGVAHTKPATSHSRERVALAEAWRFTLGDHPAATQPAFDDRGWKIVALPHDWSIEGATFPDAPSGGGGGYFPTGLGWYRHTFTVPPTWRGSRVAVEFEGAYENAGVWINGHALGAQAYGYTPFSFDLTPYLKPGDGNVLAVRVDNSNQPNSRWYTGSGLYRHVWLHVHDPVHIDPASVFVTTNASDVYPTVATLGVQATARNASGQEQSLVVDLTLVDPDGLPVSHVRLEGRAAAGDAFTVNPQMAVPHPRLWSPESPSLYRVVARIFIGTLMTDRVEKTFGIRTVGVSAARGFELNGQPVKLAGGNVHHDHGPLGAASFDRAEERKAGLLKAAGFNAVRTAHNPPSTAFLAACDRLGLLVVNEIFDGWARAKTKAGYSTVFNEHWQRDLDATVLRDRNHPSVAMWSIGNEMYERGAASGPRLAAELAARVRRLDPTRPVTAGVNGLGTTGDWTRLDPLFASLQVAGYNYETARHADDHARLPNRVIMSAESYLSDAFTTWAATEDHPYFLGDFVWAAQDYLGEAGIGRVFIPGETVRAHWEGEHYPWHGAACGDLDLIGQRKPGSHYRNIVWNRGETLHTAVLAPTPDGQPWNLSKWAPAPLQTSWTWPGHEGRPLTVEVYARHDAVRLYLNDRLIGEQPTTRAEQFKAVFDVPYAPGTLTAVGVRNGAEVERFQLTTVGTATQLRLTVDRPTLRADGQDLAFVTVEVLDHAGRWQPHADHTVQFTLSGPGTIAGIGSADLTTTESYQANPRRVFQGRALVVVRTGTTPGELTLNASADGLASARINLTSTPTR